MVLDWVLGEGEGTAAAEVIGFSGKELCVGKHGIGRR